MATGNLLSDVGGRHSPTKDGESRLAMLLCGAVRQMGAALSHVTRRLDTLEYQLAPAIASGTLPR